MPHNHTIITTRWAGMGIPKNFWCLKPAKKTSIPVMNSCGSVESSLVKAVLTGDPCSFTE